VRPRPAPSSQKPAQYLHVTAARGCPATTTDDTDGARFRHVFLLAA